MPLHGSSCQALNDVSFAVFAADGIHTNGRSRNEWALWGCRSNGKTVFIIITIISCICSGSLFIGVDCLSEASSF